MLTPRTRFILAELWLVLVIGGGLTVLARGPVGGVCTTILTLIASVYVLERREGQA
jgi:hypothetical protein